MTLDPAGMFCGGCMRAVNIRFCECEGRLELEFLLYKTRRALCEVISVAICFQQSTASAHHNEAGLIQQVGRVAAARQRQI